MSYVIILVLLSYHDLVFDYMAEHHSFVFRKKIVEMGLDLRSFERRCH